MTYLELVNAVLIRLREDEITGNPSNPSGFLLDPYYKSIGAHINDAKDRVEDAWQWGALRATDTFALSQSSLQVSGPTVALPNSLDSNYIIKNINIYKNSTGTASFTGARGGLTWTNIGQMDSYYQNPDAAATGAPSFFAVTGEAQTTGLFPFGTAQAGQIKCTLFPYPTDATYWIEIDRVAHQASLVLPSDRLYVPSLPVFTLATALASRERGEVGGAPTSELFATADRHLADAISIDSALYANELDWFANTNENNTNVRFA